jgi:hypothetical protein
MTAASCLVLLWAIAAALPAEAGVAWRTGSALEAELQEPIDLALSEAPLRKALGDLSLRRRLAVFIDRRIDPGRLLKVDIRDMPLEKALRQIAQNHGLGLTFLGPVAYFGPPQAAARLRTVVELRREELRRLPGRLGKKFLRAQPVRWPDFATPRDLLTKLAAENDLTIVGLEQIPHDLWAAADLPPLSLTERLTLILGQFDYTFSAEHAGGRIRLVPLPDDVALLRSYAPPGDPQQTAKRWAARVPGAKIQVQESWILVRGLLEEQEQIAALAHPGAAKTAAARPPRSTQPRVAEKRFTVPKSRGRLEFLLQEYAKRLGVEVRIDREALQRAGVSLDQVVSFSVTEATVEELFQAIAAAAHCTCRRVGDVIEVSAAR